MAVTRADIAFQPIFRQFILFAGLTNATIISITIISTDEDWFMTTAISTKQILKAVNHPLISLYRANGHGYWYFVFDDRGPCYETESVYTVRLNDLTVDQWVAYARDLIARCES